MSDVAKKMSQFLSDTFIVYVKTLNYHWNIVGEEFFMYHKLLEGQYEELADAIDIIAERIRMIGHLAPGSCHEFLKLATIKEGNSKLAEKKMILDLIKDHEAISKQAKSIVILCDQTGDIGTSDLLINRLRMHDKYAYLLRSHFVKKS